MNIEHPTTHPAPDALRVYVAEMISRYGVPRTMRELGITRHAVLAIAAGAPVYAGTRLQVLEAARAKGIEL